MTEHPDGLSPVPSAAELGERGLRDAMARLRHAESESDPTAAAAALVECVMWVQAIAEHRGERATILDGLRWARNTGVHQLAHLSRETAGRAYPRTYPMRFWHLAWRQRAAISLTKPEAPSQVKIQEY